MLRSYRRHGQVTRVQAQMVVGLYLSSLQPLSCNGCKRDVRPVAVVAPLGVRQPIGVVQQHKLNLCTHCGGEREAVKPAAIVAWSSRMRPLRIICC